MHAARLTPTATHTHTHRQTHACTHRDAARASSDTERLRCDALAHRMHTLHARSSDTERPHCDALAHVYVEGVLTNTGICGGLLASPLFVGAVCILGGPQANPQAYGPLGSTHTDPSTLAHTSTLMLHAWDELGN
jgi:hypothetical protein